MKKLIICVLLLAVFFNTTAVPNLTDAELEIIKTIVDEHINYTCLSPADALSSSMKYRTDILDYAAKSNFSEQAILIIDNMMSTEVHTHLYEIDMKNPEIKPNINSRIKKAVEWINIHKNESGVSAYAYYTTADIISCGLSFMSLSEIISYGLRIRDYYLKAVEIDPTASLAYSGLAQWYYHAPSLSGGSTKKAYTNFELSYKYASLKGEKFLANIYMSQSCFDQKKYNDAVKYLADADEILPGSRIVSYIKKLNDAGFSYFYYIVNREEVEKKLKNS